MIIRSDNLLMVSLACHGGSPPPPDRSQTRLLPPSAACNALLWPTAALARRPTAPRQPSMAVGALVEEASTCVLSLLPHAAAPTPATAALHSIGGAALPRAPLGSSEGAREGC